MQRKRVATMDLSGKQYAKVNERLKVFRSDCPNALIETVPTITATSIMFRCRILKDKKDPASAEATGHSYKELKNGESPDKILEKQETIAVGRALALMGYAPDGEIASSEEMEDFHLYQEQQKETMMLEYTERIEGATTLDELKDVWASIPVEGGFKTSLQGVKDALKDKLTKKTDEKAPIREKQRRVAKVAKGEGDGEQVG